MAYEHKLPSELNPAGDIIVPLCIPHDPHWISLFLGVIGTLEQEDYYQRDSNYDNENALIVVERWRETTITALINSIANAEHCGGSMLAKTASIELGSDETTTSSIYVNIANASLNYSTSKPNVLVRVTALIVNSANIGTFIRPALDGSAGLDETEGRNQGTNGRTVTVSERWENVASGSHTFNFQMKVGSASTGRINSSVNIIWEILEWD